MPRTGSYFFCPLRQDHCPELTKSGAGQTKGTPLNPKILVLEDTQGEAASLRSRLREHGYLVAAARAGDAGMKLALAEDFDLIVLDIALPGADGLAFCERLRETGLTTPILMLSARRKTKDKVAGLRAGSDDYLTKPFQTLELLARVEALLRRVTLGAQKRASRHKFGPITVGIGSTEVKRDNKKIEMTAKEFQLLRYFLLHRNVTLSQETLHKEIWGFKQAKRTRTVDVHIAWLRKKIGPNPRQPRFLLTVRGFGYKFVG